MFRIKLFLATTALAATAVAVAVPAGLNAPPAESAVSAVHSVTASQPFATAAVAAARSAARPAQQALARPAPVNCRTVKCIALTFDDGPVPDTNRLLGVLAKRKAKATFFVLGQQVAKHPRIVRNASRAGHQIGVHSWAHAKLTSLSYGTVRADLWKTGREIRRATGVQPTLMRPPYGATNGTVRAAAAKQGMRQILWDVDTEDWKNRNVGVTTRRALAGAKPGAIILMHDIRPTSVEATARVIDKLSRQGYRFVTVSELGR